MSKHWPPNNVVRADSWSPRRRRPKTNPWVPLALLGGAALAGAAVGAGEALLTRGGSVAAASDMSAIRASFDFCHTGGGTNCVVDGDTIWLGGQRIRVADIDAPETHPPRCNAEAELGNRATQRLRQLLNGGAISLQPVDRDEDQYGRKLRVVLVDGRSVGDTLVDEGLARYYGSGRRAWC